MLRWERGSADRFTDISLAQMLDKRPSVCFGKVIAISAAILLTLSVSISSVSQDKALGETDSGSVGFRLGQLPLSFIENAGQSNPAVRFQASGLGYSIFLTPTEVVFSITQRTSDASIHTSSVSLGFKGANSHPVIEGLEPSTSVVNYFLGNDPQKWRTNVPTFGAVVYRDLYPGIDLIYRGHEGLLKSEFVIAPGAAPTSIRLYYAGMQGIDLRQDGALVLKTELGEMVEDRPLVFQDIDGKHVEVKGSYVLSAGAEVSFVLEEYDSSYPLVIDPVLVYSTYLGGSLTERAQSIAVDDLGNVYLTGYTNSSNFPISGAYQGSLAEGSGDAFVTKISSNGETIVYSTYLGGGYGDEGYDIAVDTYGNAYITGKTGSLDFPTANAYQRWKAGLSGDAFLTKLSSTGDALIYSTYLGGSGGDVAYGIAVDDSGNAYITGETQSPDFPMQNPAQLPGMGLPNGFVTKFASEGDVLIYSTFVGGNLGDSATDIAIDPAGNAYVTGTTTSEDFPVVHPYKARNFPHSGEAFVTKISTNGETFIYSTYMGGSGYEEGYAIAVDDSGNAYVTGYTNSTDFPTQTPYQLDAGGLDAFVSKLSSDGDTLVYSTYLGGSGDEIAFGIGVDSTGHAYVTGATTSSDFPTRNPYQPDHVGSDDVFVAELSTSGDALVYSTYLAGSENDGVDGFAGLQNSKNSPALAVDNSGNAYVTGGTNSPDFPTVSPIQGFNAGQEDVFVAKLARADEVFICPSYPLEIGHLRVTDLRQNLDPGITISCDAPSSGRLMLVVENPDESRDGHFGVGIRGAVSYERWLELDTCRHESFVGIYWSYPCIGTKGLLRNRLEVDIAAGPTDIQLRYIGEMGQRFAGQDNTGPDTLAVYFEPDPISLAGATMLTTFAVGPQDASSYTATLTGPGYALIDVTQTGAEVDHGGSFFFYLDGAALSATNMRTEENQQITPHTLALPLEEAHSYTFKIAHEDSRWDDNVGPRSADIYFVSEGNNAPIANAGPDQSVGAGSTVQLEGSGSSDPDGDPLSYTWSFLSKPCNSNATLSNPNAVNPIFVADKEGTYKLQLEVSDGRGGTDTDEVAVDAGGLVGYWRFEGSLQDCSGNANDATVSIGDPGYVAGSIGQGIRLTDDRVDISWVHNDWDSFTVEAWFHLNNMTAGSGQCTDPDGCNIWMDEEANGPGTWSHCDVSLNAYNASTTKFDDLEFYCDDGNSGTRPMYAEYKSGVTQNQWHYLVMTAHRRAESNGYYDAEFVGSWPQASWGTPGATLYLGGRNFRDHNLLTDGTLDEIRIYKNRVLSGSEVLARCAESAPPGVVCGGAPPDTTAPDTIITISPPGSSNNSSATFEFTGSDDVTPTGSLTYECRLDGGSFSSCVSPKTYNGLADAAHTFEVRATDQAGNTGSTPASFSWTIDTTAPNPPTLLSPLDNSVINDNTPTFDWADVSDPSGVTYTLQVDNNSDFSSPEINEMGLTESTVTPSTALADATYQWRVRATDGAGNTGGWSTAYASTTDATPPPPAAPSVPANGSSGSDNTPTSDWSDVTDPSGVTYCLQVDNDAGFSSPEINVCGLTSSTYTASTGLSDGTYNWHASAEDGAGNVGAWSTTFTFTIDTTAPGVPTLLLPTNGEQSNPDRPTFDWTDVTDLTGVTYCLEVDNNANFSSPEVDVCGLGESTYTSGTGLSEGTYSWHVRAVDGVGNTGEWSAPSTFTVDTTLPAVTITSPTSASLVYVRQGASFNVQFTTNEAGTYTIQVRGVSCGGPGSASMGTNSSACTLPSPFFEGTTDVTVQVADASGNAGADTEAGAALVDNTNPEVTGSLAPAATNGWNNTSVTVSFDCHDLGDVPSGIAIDTVPDLTVTTEGANQSVTSTGDCIDRAGNNANPATVTGIGIDTHPPTIDITSTPVPNPDGWNNSDVTISFICTDDLSGVDTPPVSPQIVDGEGQNQSRSATCTDKAGNSSSTTAGGINIDKTAPSVKVTKPNGGELISAASAFTITWSCSDDLSGGAVGSIALSYSMDSGATFPNFIAGNEANDGAYNWQVPDIDAKTVRVQVLCTDKAGNTGSDMSDSNFTISRGPKISATKKSSNASDPHSPYYEVGQQIQYTVILTNESATAPLASGSGAEFSDAITDRYLQPVPNLRTASSGRISYNSSTRTFNWDGEIPPGGSVTLTFRVRILPSPDFRNRQACNQGMVHVDMDFDGRKETDIPTDDPSTAAVSGDPTCVAVQPGELGIERQEPLSLKGIQLFWLAGQPAMYFAAMGTGIERIHVQLFNLLGQRVYDSGWVENGLMWNLRDADGKRIANGVYLYVLAARGTDGKVLRSQVKKLVLLR